MENIIQESGEVVELTKAQKLEAITLMRQELKKDPRGYLCGALWNYLQSLNYSPANQWSVMSRQAFPEFYELGKSMSSIKPHQSGQLWWPARDRESRLAFLDELEQQIYDKV